MDRFRTFDRCRNLGMELQPLFEGVQCFVEKDAT